MKFMDRWLSTHTVEGEIGLVIDYQPGQVLAVDVLQAAMGMISALDALDATLLSSVDTSLEPVSVLNDIQHSSLKMLLARALRNVPDELLGNLDWKKWIGGLLVKGKYKLLPLLDADAPAVQRALLELEEGYRGAPALAGYAPPRVAVVMDALGDIAKARAALPGQKVTVQTELGDVELKQVRIDPVVLDDEVPAHEIVNRGMEYFKVKSPDMLGTAQWTVLRGNRSTKVDMLHKSWLDAYHRREYAVQPGDSLKCNYEERIAYDAQGNELERSLAVVEVLEVVSPPVQRPLI